MAEPTPSGLGLYVAFFNGQNTFFARKTQKNQMFAFCHTFQEIKHYLHQSLWYMEKGIFQPATLQHTQAQHSQKMMKSERVGRTVLGITFCTQKCKRHSRRRTPKKIHSPQKSSTTFIEESDEPFSPNLSETFQSSLHTGYF